MLAMAALPRLFTTDGLGLPHQDPTMVTHRSDDRPFWENFRRRFHTDDAYLDFRCNAASSIPKTVLEHLQQSLVHVEALPSNRNEGLHPGEKERLRVQIATDLNAGTDEVALLRNTTEALNNVIMGYPFAEGDEVLVSVHEYDSMIASLHQQELRKGIKIVRIDVPYQPESAEEIVGYYQRAMTPRTRLILISHIVWISGQIYPVKEICQLARRNGIHTVIDAAQSYSHIPIDVQDIDCDYLGASLHKWAAAPLGTGFLYVRREQIARTMPLMTHYHYPPDAGAIEKFEGLGTITPVFQSAARSLDLWQELDPGVKTQRMQYLKEYWVTKLRDNKKVDILTHTDPTHSCGIAFFAIRGRSAQEVSQTLRNKHRIVTQAIENYQNEYVDYRGVNAIGIATPVFTLERHLDRFCEVVNELTA